MTPGTSQDIRPSEAALPLDPASEPMHAWAQRLWPLCRSLTGDGVRRTLRILQDLMPELVIHEVPSGTRAFDWIVPDEWNLRAAHLVHESGERVLDLVDSNLHVAGYSVPVDAVLTLEELQPHLHSLPAQPSAIPYVTSYYERRWGFCLTHERRVALMPGRYHARIDSSLTAGALSYGELVLPGSDTSEILLSTYVCHPSMANNELSGPVVTTALARWLMRRRDRRHTYRIIFIPETIGSLVYLSRHLTGLQKNLIAGFVVTCCGDERAYSFLPTPGGRTLADRAARHALARVAGTYEAYSFLQRGSDERQYCAPRVSLPVASIMRSKYGAYAEYHTSLDDLTLVTQKGLAGAANVYRHCIEALELNRVYRAAVVGEPHLARHGLMGADTRAILDLVAYADGMKDLIAIADEISRDALALGALAEQLVAAGILERAPEAGRS